MLDEIAHAAGCECFVIGEKRRNAVWLCEHTVEVLNGVQEHVARKIIRKFSFYADHGLGVFSPPNYVAYQQHTNGPDSFVLGRFRAGNLRAYGFETDVGDWKVFVVTSILPKKKSKKTDKKLLARAVANGWDVIEGIKSYGKD